MTTRIYTIDDLPLKNLIVNEKYMIQNATPEQLAEGERRIRETPVAANRFVRVYQPVGMPGWHCFVVETRRLAAEETRGTGRPPGDVATALQKLMIDDFVVFTRSGRTEQTMRNLVHRAGKRMQRRFSVNKADYNDKRMEWTEAMKDDYTPDDFYIVQRIE